MKLWLLRPLDLDVESEKANPWHFPYDCYHGFVVRAIDERTARSLASKRPGDEGATAWLDPNLSSCEEIGVSKALSPEEIVLSDFAAG